MTYSETATNYAKALMLGVTAPTEALSNECAAIASQIGSSLKDKDKRDIQKSIEVQVRLRDFLAGRS